MQIFMKTKLHAENRIIFNSISLQLHVRVYLHGLEEASILPQSGDDSGEDFLIGSEIWCDVWLTRGCDISERIFHTKHSVPKAVETLERGKWLKSDIREIWVYLEQWDMFLFVLLALCVVFKNKWIPGTTTYKYVVYKSILLLCKWPTSI